MGAAHDTKLAWLAKGAWVVNDTGQGSGCSSFFVHCFVGVVFDLTAHEYENYRWNKNDVMRWEAKYGQIPDQVRVDHASPPVIFQDTKEIGTEVFTKSIIHYNIFPQKFRGHNFCLLFRH